MGDDLETWRLLIGSESQVPIHGIRLRELSKYFAETHGITGYARNIDSNKVEIICQCLKEEDAQGLFRSIHDAAKAQLHVGIVLDQCIQADILGQFQHGINFSTFEVVREGPFQEIDWAIRGAEHLFRNLHSGMERFVKERDQRNLMGISRELKRMRSFMEESNVRARLSKAHRSAIDRFMAQPFDDDLFKICTDINDYVEEIEMNSNTELTSRDREKLAEILDNGIAKVKELESNFKEKGVN